MFLAMLMALRSIAMTESVDLRFRILKHIPHPEWTSFKVVIYDTSVAKTLIFLKLQKSYL